MAISEHLRRIREYVGHDLLLVPSVAVLPRDASGRILLVLDADFGQWGTIGGAVEVDESPRAAACREAAEEAGVAVRLDGILDVVGGPDFRIRYPNGDETAYVSTIYAASVIGGAPTPDGDETIDAAWFAPEELPELDLRPFARAALTQLGILSDR